MKTETYQMLFNLVNFHLSKMICMFVNAGVKMTRLFLYVC